MDSLKKAFSLLLIPLFFSLVSISYAETDVNLLDTDEVLGERLGIGEFAGGLLLTLFTLFVFLGTLGAVTRRVPSRGMTLLIGISVQAFCIAVGWFPVWSLVFEILLIALFFGRRIIGGF